MSAIRIGPGEGVVSEETIRRQVHTFYARAIDDWDEHLDKLCDFWSSVLLATGRFRGSPMAAHARRPAIRTSTFHAGWTCSSAPPRRFARPGPRPCSSRSRG